MLDQQYWTSRYDQQATGWDLGVASPPLISFAKHHATPQSAIMIPGAGMGHEARFLHQEGFTDVHVIDIAAPPLTAIQVACPHFPEKHLHHQDFFSHQGTYDLILEQTFFCALEPVLRPAYVAHMASILKPGAVLAGVLFNFPLTSQGPPFGGDADTYRSLFEEHFTIEKLEPCQNSHPSRAGKELFFVCKKM